MSVALKAYGYGNMVVYTGKAQPAADAFASIMSYLDPNELVYYYNNVGGYYEGGFAFIEGAWRFYGFSMVPYGVYWIAVTQDCIWTYGAEETAPSSVQLYSGRTNLVAYSGPSQSVEAAFSSIWDYLLLDPIYYDTYQGWLTPDTIISNTVYGVRVDRDCVWSFVAELAFAPGESKNAIAPITVKPAGLNCEAEVFLGTDEATKVATSGRIPFTSTGVSQNVHLPIAMPATEGAYHVYLDVYAEGILVAAYQAIEDVVIKVAEQVVRAYYKGMVGMNIAIMNNAVSYNGQKELDPNYYGVSTDWRLCSTFTLPADASITQVEFDALYTYGYNRFDYRWTDQKPGETERTIAEGYVEPAPNYWTHYAVPISS